MIFVAVDHRGDVLGIGILTRTWRIHHPHHLDPVAGKEDRCDDGSGNAISHRMAPCTENWSLRHTSGLDESKKSFAQGEDDLRRVASAHLTPEIEIVLSFR